MSQVSKRKIKDEDYKRVFRKFIKTLEISKSKHSTEAFVQEFFYPTERIMFAKRIGILCMIIEGIPDRVIAETLAVSTSTVGRIIDKIDKGQYKYLKSIIRTNTKNDKESLLDLVEEIFMILPVKGALRRYRYVRQRRLSAKRNVSMHRYEAQEV